MSLNFRQKLSVLLGCVSFFFNPNHADLIVLEKEWPAQLLVLGLISGAPASAAVSEQAAVLSPRGMVVVLILVFNS